MLRTNIVELKTMYEKRCNLAYEYTESEHIELKSGLQSLETDVLRLFAELDEVSGYRAEIEKVIETYTNYESRYRILRSVNKNAKLRTTTCKTKNENEEDNSFDLCALLRNICEPCRRMFQKTDAV